MSNTRNSASPYTWRQQQLSHMEQRKIDQIVDPVIATAESILNYSINPTPTLRGTAAKQIRNAMGAVAGYKGAPMRKMQNLIKKLCPRAPYEIPYYPTAELPPKNIIEEITDLATEVRTPIRACWSQSLGGRVRLRCQLDRLEPCRSCFGISSSTRIPGPIW